MAAPGDRPAFDLNIAISAAENFKARKKQRDAKEKAISEGQYTKAESPDRLAKRVNRLLGEVHKSIAAAAVKPDGQVASATEALPEQVHDLVRQGPVTAEDVNDALLERVIGATRDFLAIGFFDRGTIASRAVCRVVTNL